MIPEADTQQIPILGQVIVELAAERDQAIADREHMRSLLVTVTGRDWPE